MTSRSFTELEGRTSTARRMCGRCGSPAVAGVVSASCRTYGSPDSRHALKGGKTLASLSRSLCESCAVSIYEAVEEALQS